MAVVFPRPPPTYNTLTNTQRAQLLRTNAKLGRLLGSTPHILDDTKPLPPLPTEEHVFCSDTKTQRGAQGAHTNSRGSIDSQSSTCASSSTHRSSVDSHTSSSSQISSDSQHSERQWRIRFPTRRPPMLRIGKTPRILDSIPGSPPYDSSSSSSSQSSLPSPESDSPPPTPSFAIPSESALRRQKMRRLTKKLGEGVPVHLVFPPTTESDDEEVIVDSPTSSTSSYDSEKEMLWEKHTARRSRFVQPPKSMVTAGRYVVHYHDTSGIHGLAAETFEGLKCGTITTIPEE